MQTKAKGARIIGLVYSYVRFSSVQQADGTSLARQMTYARRWATEHGLVLDESLTMRDEGKSAYHGKHVKRGALGAFLREIEAGKVPSGSVLIVESLDRLSRAEPLDAQEQFRAIIYAGVTIVTSDTGMEYSREGLSKDPTPLFLALATMIRAHEESKKKSERIQDAYAEKCDAWDRGVRIGEPGIKAPIGGPNTDPNWLTFDYVTMQFRFVEPMASTVRRIVDLYCEGYGAIALVNKMRDEGYEFGGRFPAHRVHRIMTQRALMGDKVLVTGGTERVLKGYYGKAALITPEKFEEVQNIVSKRGKRRRVRSEVPSVLTGHELVWCGYCGSLMVGQNQLKESNRLADGTYRLGARRLRCGLYYRSAKKCIGGESCSVAPVEHAILTYCSDQMNLSRLLATEEKSDPRLAALAAARQEMSALETKLARIKSSLLDDDGDGFDTLRDLSRELDGRKRELTTKLAKLEREVAIHQRAMPSTAEVWASLVDDVRLLDTDARIKARKLLADTFERVDVFAKGIHADQTKVIRLRLTSKSGVVREFDIDRTTGARLEEDSFETANIHAKGKPARKTRTRAGIGQ